MKQVHYSVTINATKEQVWATLWQDESFRDWASIIDPGTYMVGDLKVDSEIQFISSENGYGVTSLVERLTVGEFLLLRHHSDTQDSGKHHRANQWTGGEESYSLTSNDGLTTLDVTLDIPTELEEILRLSYPLALKRVKHLAERI